MRDFPSLLPPPSLLFPFSVLSPSPVPSPSALVEQASAWATRDGSSQGSETQRKFLGTLPHGTIFASCTFYAGCRLGLWRACNGGFSPRSPRPSTRPPVLLRPRRQSRHHRVVLDVPDHFSHFLPIPHPPVIRLRLPKGFPCSAQEQVRVASGTPFDSPHHFARIHQRPDQQMDMVRHHHPRKHFTETIYFRGVANAPADQFCDIRPSQPHWSGASGVQIAVHPDEGLAGGRRMSGRRIAALREASVEMPGDKERAVLGMPMWKATLGDFHVDSWRGAERNLKARRGLKPPLQAKACSTSEGNVIWAS